MHESPKVSVAVFTYNQEHYLSQTLESVLSQKTAFPFEVVIGEDCSSDRTRDIVLDFHARYGAMVRPLLNATNLGQYGNVLQTLQACQGEYIAVVEGDDYWTSADKLQIQADFLDANPGCAMCFHQVLHEYEDGSQPSRITPERHKPVSTIEDLLAGNFIPTCSNMFRKGPNFHIPAWAADVHFTDWPMHVMNARSGYIGFIPRCMGVYRVHGGGVWSTQAWKTVMERWVRAYQCINADLDYRYDRIIKEAIFTRLLGYAVSSIEQQSDDASTAVWRAVRTLPPWRLLDKKLVLLAKMYTPFLIRAGGAMKRSLDTMRPSDRR